MRVLIFGDSITQGYFDTESGGWANRMAAHYQQETIKNLDGEWIEVFNLGIPGDSADGVLNRMRTEIETRRLHESEDCIVLAVGINDSILIENRVQNEVYDFQETYEILIDEALKLCPRVLCVGLTAVEESQTDPWPYSTTGKQWKNNRINLFEDTIKQSAERKEVAFVPIHDKFLEHMSQADMVTDGLHPNVAGHEFIFRQVLAAVEALR